MEKVVILVRPESSLNIGAVCRVMANTGLYDLRIVGEKKAYNEEEIIRLAIHAKNIWENAKFFPPNIDGLKGACADCNILAGTTRRIGAKRKTQGISPESFSEVLKTSKIERAAILFGNERTGLTAEELEICSLAVNIPADGNFPSYNLSHAVLIIAYTLFTSGLNNEITCDTAQKASFKEAERISVNINKYLKNLGMFRVGGFHDNEIFFTEIITRAGMTKTEAARFENIFKKIFFIKR